jgi:hypothetical protein
MLESITRTQAWFEERKLAVVARITALAAEHPEMLPEQVVADTTRVTLARALQPFKRADALALLSHFAPALAAGDVTADHVDVIAHAAAQLSNSNDRDRFAARSEFLAGVAARTNPAEFARTVREEVARAQRDDDGIARLQRQRRATALRWWVDQITGMWCLRGEFDPETGAALQRRLQAAVEKLFHDATPDTCPSDPMRKQDHLRALALVALIKGNANANSGGSTSGGGTGTGTGGSTSGTNGDGGNGNGGNGNGGNGNGSTTGGGNGSASAGVADISILIDAQTLATGPHDRTIVDCGIPIHLPVESIRRLLCTAIVTPIVVGADGTRLYLGRAVRLASADQRKALRALYRTCAIPGCCIAWDQLIVHHLREYVADHGPTDIDNLIPVCSKHHHLAHEGGWLLHLAADRTLTITQPDQTIMTTGPPNVWAA